MVVSITRYTITFISLNIFFFSFNKGVEPYNPTQFNHYNINLIFFHLTKELSHTTKLNPTIITLT